MEPKNISAIQSSVFYSDSMISLRKYIGNNIEYSKYLVHLYVSFDNN